MSNFNRNNKIDFLRVVETFQIYVPQRILKMTSVRNVTENGSLLHRPTLLHRCIILESNIENNNDKEFLWYAQKYKMQYLIYFPSGNGCIETQYYYFFLTWVTFITGEFIGFRIFLVV